MRVRWMGWIAGAVGLWGCGEPGACEESIVIGGVKHGFCIEVEHAGQCPTFESGDASDEVKWDFEAGKRCKQLDYEIDCGDGIWEDVETECP